MAKYTATLSAQNTNVYVCDITKPRTLGEWFANACVTGTFGTGTVTFNISFDSGSTLIPLTQDGTATAATVTAAGSINLKCGYTGVLANAKLYASVGAAATPSLAITVLDNG